MYFSMMCLSDVQELVDFINVSWTQFHAVGRRHPSYFCGKYCNSSVKIHLALFSLMQQRVSCRIRQSCGIYAWHVQEPL